LFCEYTLKGVVKHGGRTSNDACWTDDWNVGTSDWRTEKESCSNEDGYENKMDGNENQWYGKDDRAEEKSYRQRSNGPGNDQTRQISPTEEQY